MAEDIKEMIARAKAELAAEQAGSILSTIKPATTFDPAIPEPPNAEGVALIVKELAALNAQRTHIEKRESDLKDVLKVLVGTNQGLRHGDQTLFVVTRSHPQRVNQAYIKEHYDPNDHPEFWSPVKEEVRITIDPAVKASVFDPANAELPQ